MIKLKFLTLLSTTLLLSLQVNAQQLQQLFSKYKNAKTTTIRFSQQGVTYCLNSEGTKYRLTSDNNDILFDGQTLYSYSASTNELVIENLSASSSLLLNPVALFSLDLADFTYFQKGNIYHLIPNNTESSQINEIIVELKDDDIKSISITALSSDTIELDIISTKINENSKVVSYKFDKKSYPKAEIIDFR